MLSLLKHSFTKYYCQFFFLSLFLAAGFSSKACSPLNAPTLLSQSIAGNFLNINWQSTTTWLNCSDEIDVEIACDASPFSGLPAFTFTSGAVTLTSNPQNYPTQSIDISALCPGMAYKFRARHRNSGIGSSSPWSSTFTFTVPGVFVPPVLTLIPTNPVICPGQTSSIGIYNNACSNAFSTFTWIPATGLSCNTCSNPVASPTITTTYTVDVVGSQMACWSQSAAVTIIIANPTVVVTTPSICPGQTATITATGADNFYWSYGSFPNGPGTGGAAPVVTTNYTVTGNTAGCTATALATVFVYPLPTLTLNNPVACIGQTINITASGAASYTWQGPLSYTSTAQNPSIPNASLNMAGGYSVMATSAQGCTTSAISLVAVQALPVPVISSNNPPCLNSTLSFTGSGAVSYQWTGPNGFSWPVQTPLVNNVSLAAAGVYTMVGSIGSCSASTTATISIRSLPNPNAQSSSPVCAGKTLSLTGTGGVTYYWQGPATFLSNSQNPTVSNVGPLNAGVYTLVVTGTNNCTNSDTTSVGIGPLPVITGSNLGVCYNKTINLTANGGATYLWQGPNTFISTSQNTVITNANYGQAGQYSLTVTSAVGCSAMVVSNVTIITLPVPTIVSTTSICTGSNLQLVGTGGTSYLWSGPNGFGSAAQNPVINLVPVANTGVYTLSATVGFCTGVTTRSITIMPLPTQIAANTGPVCDTKTLQLTSSGATNCFWALPDGSTTTAPNPIFASVSMSTAGVYTLTVTDANNCQLTSLTSVIVYPNPTISAVGATVCSGQPAVITSNGGQTYKWIGPGNFLSLVANATIPVVTPANAGTYTVIVGSVNSCTSISGVPVVAMALPSPSLIVTPRACVNSSISLEAFGGLAYAWTGPADFISTDQAKVFVATSMAYNGTYTLTAFNSAGCPGYTTTTIIIDPLPDGNLVSDNGDRCVPFCGKFRLAPMNNTPILTTIWKINGLVIPADTFNYCISDPGAHLLTGIFTDANGCSNTATFVIDAFPLPIADFSYEPPMPVEGADRVEFTNRSEGEQITKVNWAFVSNNNYKTTSQHASYVFDDAGIYPVSLVVKNVWGCFDTIVKPIKVESDFIIFVPNVFTPNEDDKNETFQPKGRGVVEYELTVFDRWGEKVFHTTDFETGWDGIFKNKHCKSDVYQWHIIAGNGRGVKKDLSGHVTLYR